MNHFFPSVLLLCIDADAGTNSILYNKPNAIQIMLVLHK